MEDFDYRNADKINDSGYLDDSMISNNENNLERSGFNDFLLVQNSENNNVNEKSSQKSNQNQFESSLETPKKNNNDFISDDIFDPSYKISMNKYANRFNTSRIARQFIYESNGKPDVSILKSKKFCLMENDQIMTYLVNLFIFSEFENLSEIEKDDRIKVIFIKKDQNLNKFAPVTDATLNNLNISLEQKSEFNNFIKGINEFLENENYVEIEKGLKKYKFYMYGTTIGLIIGLLVIACSIYFILKKENGALKIFLSILTSILAIVVISLLISHFIKAKKYRLFVIYNLMEYLLIHNNEVCDYIEDWNKKFFENNKIRVNVPISLNYIMFNLNPYQEIEIKHLDMDYYKRKLYKNKNIVFKDKHLYKFLKKIQNNSQAKELQNENSNNYYSIN